MRFFDVQAGTLVEVGKEVGLDGFVLGQRRDVASIGGWFGVKEPVNA